MSTRYWVLSPILRWRNYVADRADRVFTFDRAGIVIVLVIGSHFMPKENRSDSSSRSCIKHAGRRPARFRE